MANYFEGMLYGLVFVFSFGPAFLALMQTSIQAGFKRAICVSAGVNMTDVVWITLVLVGLSSFLEGQLVSFWMGILGVGVLLLFGFYSWKKPVVLPGQETEEIKPYYRYWLKGLALNGFNPMVVFFWIGIVGTVSSIGYSKEQMFTFFAGFLSTVFITDCIKAYLITKFAHLITERSLRILNKAIGVVFMLFGIQLLIYLLGWNT